MWQADAGPEDRHGREKAVPGLANGSHLPPPPGVDYNPAPCRYQGFRVGCMEAKESCQLIVVTVGSI